jgi:hypothetical protein
MLESPLQSNESMATRDRTDLALKSELMQLCYAAVRPLSSYLMWTSLTQPRPVVL